MPTTTHSESLTRAVFLSSRSDAIANVAIIGPELVTLAFDLAVIIAELAIAAMNIDAAEGQQRALEEHRPASSVGGRLWAPGAAAYPPKSGKAAWLLLTGETGRGTRAKRRSSRCSALAD